MSGTEKRRYVVLVVDGRKTGPRAYIHAPTCRLVLNARGRTHAHPCEPCDSPAQAAERFDADNDTVARGLPRTLVCRCTKLQSEISAPKIALQWSPSVALASISNRPLFCVVHRATERQRRAIHDLTECARSILPPGTAGDVHKIDREIGEWHITPVTGEFLTRKAADRNCSRENASGQWIASVHEYSVDECRRAAEEPPHENPK